jgi:hypothetical protein
VSEASQSLLRLIALSNALHDAAVNTADGCPSHIHCFRLADNSGLLPYDGSGHLGEYDAVWCQPHGSVIPGEVFTVARSS